MVYIRLGGFGPQVRPLLTFNKANPLCELERNTKSCSPGGRLQAQASYSLQSWANGQDGKVTFSGTEQRRKSHSGNSYSSRQESLRSKRNTPSKQPWHKQFNMFRLVWPTIMLIPHVSHRFFTPLCLLLQFRTPSLPTVKLRSPPRLGLKFHAQIWQLRTNRQPPHAFVLTSRRITAQCPVSMFQSG